MMLSRTFRKSPAGYCEVGYTDAGLDVDIGRETDVVFEDVACGTVADCEVCSSCEMGAG